jgi:hypothetical protein
MSWGTKIAILYVGFVALIATMVALSMHENVDLVSADYYVQELNHQRKIDKIERTQKLKTQLTWTMRDGAIQINYPEEFRGKPVTGNIQFFRPSDASLDRSMPIKADSSGMQTVSTLNLKKGVYLIQIHWESEKSSYYNEGTIQLH